MGADLEVRECSEACLNMDVLLTVLNGSIVPPSIIPIKGCDCQSIHPTFLGRTLKAH